MKKRKPQISYKLFIKIFFLAALSIMLVSCTRSSEYFVGTSEGGEVLGELHEDVDEDWKAGEVSYTSPLHNEQSEEGSGIPKQDLSNIGFENRMGMDEWLTIDSFSLDDMCVYTDDYSGDWFTFADRYLYIQNSDLDGSKSSKPGKTHVITILDNNAISLPSDYENYRITARVTDSKNENFCVIKTVRTDTFNGKTREFWFAPVDLIDWKRSPEKTSNGCYAYYFKK